MSESQKSQNEYRFIDYKTIFEYRMVVYPDAPPEYRFQCMMNGAAAQRIINESPESRKELRKTFLGIMDVLGLNED